MGSFPEWQLIIEPKSKWGGGGSETFVQMISQHFTPMHATSRVVIKHQDQKPEIQCNDLLKVYYFFVRLPYLQRNICDFAFVCSWFHIT